MRTLILTSLFWCFYGINPVNACICFGPPPLDTCLKYYDAVFVGELIQINRGDSLFSVPNGGWRPTPCWNFKVLRAHKGLNADYITVFDDNGSSCSGFLTHFELGDTVLVFASYLTRNVWSNNFLWGDQCYPRYKLPLTCGDYESECAKIQRFLADTTQWKVPKEYSPFLKNLNPVFNKKKTADKWPVWKLVLLASILLNLLLAVLLWLRQTRE